MKLTEKQIEGLAQLLGAYQTTGLLWTEEIVEVQRLFDYEYTLQKKAKVVYNG